MFQPHKNRPKCIKRKIVTHFGLLKEMNHHSELMPLIMVRHGAPNPSKSELFISSKVTVLAPSLKLNTNLILSS